MQLSHPLTIAQLVGIAVFIVLAWVVSRRLRRRQQGQRDNPEAIDAAAQMPALNVRLREKAQQIRDGEFDPGSLDDPD